MLILPSSCYNCECSHCQLCHHFNQSRITYYLVQTRSGMCREKAGLKAFFPPPPPQLNLSFGLTPSCKGSGFWHGRLFNEGCVRFSSLAYKLTAIPPRLVAKRMLPRLMSRFVLADPSAEKNFLPHLLTPIKGKVLFITQNAPIVVYSEVFGETQCCKWKLT